MRITAEEFRRLHKGKTRRGKPEQGLHRAVADYLRMALPDDGDTFWFHCPNGGSRPMAEAVMLKKMGVKAGVPDICIVHDAQFYGIELKDIDAPLSQAQKKTHRSLREAKAKLVTCRSVDDVVAALDRWNIPVRCRTFGWIPRRIDQRSAA